MRHLHEGKRAWLDLIGTHLFATLRHPQGTRLDGLMLLLAFRRRIFQTSGRSTRFARNTAARCWSPFNLLLGGSWRFLWC